MNAKKRELKIKRRSVFGLAGQIKNGVTKKNRAANEREETRIENQKKIGFWFGWPDQELKIPVFWF